ncbi:MAG: orotidine-5'-phosphate decarboxylase [Chloroflexota bacterium]
MSFAEKLNSVMEKNKSLLCVGLDPDPKLMPEGVSVLDFNRKIIDATSDLVCAYKPNLAFYEAMGDEGMGILKSTVRSIPPDIPVIGDAKRADIGNTSKAYARALFEHLGFDAVTVNPYFGFDSLEPFIEYREKGIFVLCRTSNAGATDFQSLLCETPDGSRRPLYEIVADKAGKWNLYGNVGLVVGATYPEELKLIRDRHPDMVLLIPGVGAQGGDVEKTVRYGVNAAGKGAIINSSRQVLYAGKGNEFAEASRKMALSLRDQINSFLS